MQVQRLLAEGAVQAVAVEAAEREAADLREKVGAGRVERTLGRASGLYGWQVLSSWLVPGMQCDIGNSVF